MKLRICLVIIMAAIALTMTGCKPKPQTEAEISMHLALPGPPHEEIFTYTLDNTSYTSSSFVFDIEKRQTNDKEDIIYCTIETNDEYLHRTMHYQLTFNYYDQGGWILDDWRKTSKTEAYPVKAVEQSTISNILASSGYNNWEIIDSSEDIENGVCVYAINTETQYENLTITGNLILAFNFAGSDDKYSWKHELDENNVNYVWTILGSWSTSFKYDSGPTHYINLNITEITESRVFANGDAYGNQTWVAYPAGKFDSDYKYSSNAPETNKINLYNYKNRDAKYCLNFQIDVSVGGGHWYIVFTENDAFVNPHFKEAILERK